MGKCTTWVLLKLNFYILSFSKITNHASKLTLITHLWSLMHTWALNLSVLIGEKVYNLECTVK